MSSHINIKKKCILCGNEFTAKTLYTRYCSHSCNQKHYKQLQRENKIANAGSGSISQPRLVSQNDHGFEIQNKTFLSIGETAKLLGTSRRTIHRLIAGGQIRIWKIGRRTIIKRNEIDKLFQ